MLTVGRQNGFSIVELMVSMVAGLVVVAGVLSLFTSVLVSSNTSMMLSRLNQDMQVITDMLARDIQRTGYHPSAAEEIAQGVSSGVSSKYVFSTQADLYPPSGAAAAECIRIKYWDPDPASGAGSVTRIYHIEDSTVKVKTDYSAPGTAALTSGDCSGGSSLLPVDEVILNTLSFTPVSGSTSSARSVVIDIAASHASRTALSMTLQRQVKLRNDGY